jgi:D-alanine-D-alanine ligase
LEDITLKIGVIMGGTSSEREVSLNTGREMLNYLDKAKYEAVPVVVDKKDDIIQMARDLDFALLALHGKFGEDGTIQGVLETMGIPYSGCGLLSSSLCMDKDLTKKLIKADGIKTADWIMVNAIEELNYEAVSAMGYPVVVKPNSGGSSVATFVINSNEGLRNAVEEALKYDKEVMIEKYIKGDEITCCVLNGEMLPVLVIKPKSSFFDYASKYSDGGADEFVVELQKDLHNKVETMALKCYKTLKCCVYARVDMIISNGEPYVLEINTLPGMTKNSLFPKSAVSVGISFSKLLDLLIQYSLEEKR